MEKLILLDQNNFHQYQKFKTVQFSSPHYQLHNVLTMTINIYTKIQFSNNFIINTIIKPLTGVSNNYNTQLAGELKRTGHNSSVFLTIFNSIKP